jgi:hypothetical protein
MPLALHFSMHENDTRTPYRAMLSFEQYHYMAVWRSGQGICLSKRGSGFLASNNHSLAFNRWRGLTYARSRGPSGRQLRSRHGPSITQGRMGYQRAELIARGSLHRRLIKGATKIEYRKSTTYGCVEQRTSRPDVMATYSMLRYLARS